MASGYPYLAKISFSKVRTMVKASMSLRANASGHFEKVSLQVRIYLARVQELSFKGPTKSTCNCWNGYPAVGETRVCLWSPSFLVFLWHMGHDLM